MVRIYTFSIAILTVFFAFGQSGYQANQYMFNQQLINPAYAGKDYKIKGALLGNQQLVGISSAPQLVALSLSSPIKLSKTSIGLNITNFSYGVQSNTEVNLIYSHRISLKNWSLVYGLQGGIFNSSQTNSKLKTGQSGDEAFMSNYSGTEFNFGSGIYLFNKCGFISISAPSWFQHQFTADGNLERNFIKDYMPLFLSGGFEHRVSKNWWIDPYFLVRAYTNGRTMADVNLLFDYKNKFWVGPSYKTKSQVGCLVGFMLGKSIKLNYSGAISQNRVEGFMGNANELSLVFTIKDKLKSGVVSPRLF